LKSYKGGKYKSFCSVVPVFSVAIMPFNEFKKKKRMILKDHDAVFSVRWM